MRPAAIVGVVTALAGLAACADTPTNPTPPPGPISPGPMPNCLALNYPGATGGERIQRAIDDVACQTVVVSPNGPDANGVWLVTQSIRLRSNLTLASGSETL